jgi:hypothetical protein
VRECLYASHAGGRRALTGSYRPYRADSLLVEHDGPVTVVTINRPERRNAVDSVCADQLREAFLAFDATRSARWPCWPVRPGPSAPGPT